MTGQLSGVTSPRLHVTFDTQDGARRDLYFERSFRIGRQEDCEVCIPDESVSRIHAEVILYEGQWWVQDQSGGGIFVHEERIECVHVSGTLLIRLGVTGPLVDLQAELGVPVAADNQPAGQPPAPLSTLPPMQAPEPHVTVTQPMASEPMAKPQLSLDEYMQRYFGGAQSEQHAGEHTRMIRLAYQQVQTKQKRRYGRIVATLLVAVLGAGGYALYLHQQVKKQRAIAQDIFYAMKTMDVSIANVQTEVFDSHNQQGMAEIQRNRAQRQQMEKNYDQFLTNLNIYERKMSPEERLVFRITRIFGECELDMPKDFVTEVKKYIQLWRQSGRLAKGMRIARDNNYIAPIVTELLAGGLPPQFFYLALQESDFDPYISGPLTRKGIAKGMWQFIPETAVRYGLKIGPLANLRRPDPGDDRHHWDRETKAAVRYMKDLYGSDAQASGLLVMACYNWGEDYVLPLVRKLPANPRDRNFWRLLSTYGEKVPQETHDYVFYVVSAAVIGENPRLFGFDFDNPLAQLESH